MDYRIRWLNRFTASWMAYFWLADAEPVFRRLRQVRWKEWKRVRVCLEPAATTVWTCSPHRFLVSPTPVAVSMRRKRTGDERFRKSPQRGQRAVVSTAHATMPAIASTGAMLFTGHKGTSGKSALARRNESSIRLANTAATGFWCQRLRPRRDQLLFIELIDPLSASLWSAQRNQETQLRCHNAGMSTTSFFAQSRRFLRDAACKGGTSVTLGTVFGSQKGRESKFYVSNEESML